MSMYKEIKKTQGMNGFFKKEREGVQEENMDMATEVLEAAFRKVGRGYGYESVSAEFSDFREFKVQWSRSYRYAHFRVSDYLSDAPQ